MTLQEKRKLVSKTLVDELGSKDKAREFVQILAKLDIANVKNDKEFEGLIQDEGSLLFTLITYQNFGLLDKLSQIKAKIKGD